MNTLENGGFVNRETSDGDARTKYVSLTEKGYGVCNKNRTLMENCDAVIQSALSEEEQKIFKNLLLKVIEEIETRKGEK